MGRMKERKASNFKNEDEGLGKILERSLFLSEVDFGTLIKHPHITSEDKRR